MANKGGCRVNGRQLVRPSRVDSMTRTKHWEKEAIPELHAPSRVQQKRCDHTRMMLTQHVMWKVVSHPGNPSTGVSELPNLCPRLYMGACA